MSRYDARYRNVDWERVCADSAALGDTFAAALREEIAARCRTRPIAFEIWRPAAGIMAFGRLWCWFPYPGGQRTASRDGYPRRLVKPSEEELMLLGEVLGVALQRTAGLDLKRREFDDDQGRLCYAIAPKTLVKKEAS